MPKYSKMSVKRNTMKSLKASYPNDAWRINTTPLTQCPLCGGTGQFVDMLGRTTWCGCTALKDKDRETKTRIMQHIADIHQENLRWHSMEKSPPKPKRK